jgi:hypothetical protein
MDQAQRLLSLPASGESRPGRKRKSRVARGGCPPRAPTDLDVRDSRIRLLGSGTRCEAVDRVDDACRGKRVSLDEASEPLPPSRAHAPLSDPGGGRRASPSRLAPCGLPRCLPRRPPPRTDFGAPSRGLCTPCVRFAVSVTRTRRNTRYPLLARLCGAGLQIRWAPVESFRLRHRLPLPPSFSQRTGNSVPAYPAYPPICAYLGTGLAGRSSSRLGRAPGGSGKKRIRPVSRVTDAGSWAGA